MFSKIMYTSVQVKRLALNANEGFKMKKIRATRIYKTGESTTLVGTKTALEILKSERKVQAVIIGERNNRIRIDRDQIDWTKVK